MPIILNQNAIRISLFPINVIIIIVCITISAYLNNLIPNYQFIGFIFWLLKPCLHVQLMMTCIITIIGLAGNIRYSTCFQGSYTFFTLVLTGVNLAAYFFSKDLPHSIETIIPKLDRAEAYLFERLASLTEINMLRWEPTECNCSQVGELNTCTQDADIGNRFYWVYSVSCMDLYPEKGDYTYSDIGQRAFAHSILDNLVDVFIKWNLILTAMTAIYTVFNAFFAIFVRESTQYQSEEKQLSD